MCVDVREKRSVLEQKQSSVGFQDLFDIDREKRDIELDDAEIKEEMELRSYGSHLRFTLQPLLPRLPLIFTFCLSLQFIQGMNAGLQGSSMMSSQTATMTKGSIFTHPSLKTLPIFPR